MMMQVKLPRLVLLIAVLISFGTQAAPTKWKLDPAHTVIEFKVLNLGISNVRGSFSTFTGGVTTDIDLANIKSAGDETSTDFTKINFANTKVMATMDASSLSTNQAQRDAHLKSPDFFNIEKFPKIMFEATGFGKAQSSSVEMMGNLTIHGITKPIVLKVEGLKKAKSPDGTENIGLTASTSIDRMDFGMRWNKIAEKLSVVSREVRIFIEVRLLPDVPAPTVAPNKK